MSAGPVKGDLNEGAIEAALSQIRSFSDIAASRLRPVPITPVMLAAGRAAFKRNRKLIDDLWQAFDCDIDTAIRDIYRSMARAAE